MELIEKLKQKIAKEEEQRQLLEMAIGATGLKNYGEYAWAGAQLANRRKHKQYLRAHRLGKFRKGKRK